jgi:hypothetical protein
MHGPDTHACTGRHTREDEALLHAAPLRHGERHELALPGHPPGEIVEPFGEKLQVTGSGEVSLTTCNIAETLLTVDSIYTALTMTEL